jgi:CheY-like chemotaxis protein
MSPSTLTFNGPSKSILIVDDEGVIADLLSAIIIPIRHSLSGAVSFSASLQGCLARAFDMLGRHQPFMVLLAASASSVPSRWPTPAFRQPGWAG